MEGIKSAVESGASGGGVQRDGVDGPQQDEGAADVGTDAAWLGAQHEDGAGRALVEATGISKFMSRSS